jgi:hypothetical protein
MLTKPPNATLAAVAEPLSTHTSYGIFSIAISSTSGPTHTPATACTITLWQNGLALNAEAPPLSHQ